MNDINKKRKIILQMQHMGMKVDPADLEEVERDYDAKYIKTFCEHITQCHEAIYCEIQAPSAYLHRHIAPRRNDTGRLRYGQG